MWLERILGHEGGFSLDPNDRGNYTGGEVGIGELKGTKWGIASNTYPHLDIKNLTSIDAAKIYRADYLEPLAADLYADGVAFQLLDFAVNSGPRRAIKSIQKVVKVKADGIIGDKTIDAINQYSESDLIMLLTAYRIDFMTRLKTWKHHGQGWMRRIAGNLRYGAIDS